MACGICHAQVPQLITSQAVLRDANGALVDNQTIGVRVSIRQGAANGPIVYSETHTPTTNANGLYTLLVGNGTPTTGTFSSINWGQNTYFVVSEADPTGGTRYTMQTVQQLVSVPYALYASHSMRSDTATMALHLAGLTDSINNALRNITVIHDTLTSYVYSVQRDTHYIIELDTLFHIDTLYSIITINNWDTLVFSTHDTTHVINNVYHRDTTHSYDTLVRITRDTTHVINNIYHHDTTHVINNIYHRDTLILITHDTIHNSSSTIDTHYVDSTIQAEFAARCYATCASFDSLRQHNVWQDSLIEVLRILTGDRQAPIEGQLPGNFSNSDSSTISFSKGNLQYQASTSTWRFAEQQYDYLGSNAGNTQSNLSLRATQSEWIDLFGFGTSGWNSGANSYQPYSNSNSSSDYRVGGSVSQGLTGDYANADWGIYNAISNGGNEAGLWRTLSIDEWAYILYTRTASTVNDVANARYSKVTVCGHQGLLLFPDSYTHPSEVPLPTNINQTSASFGGTIYDATQWGLMEQAGVVFLPLSGYRTGSSLGEPSYVGNYWSSSVTDGNANHIDFYPGYVYATHDYTPRTRAQGLFVRLVRNGSHTDEQSSHIMQESLDSLRRMYDSLCHLNDSLFILHDSLRTRLQRRIDSLIVHAATPTNPCTGRTTYGIAVISTTDHFTWIDGNTYTASTSSSSYTLRGANAEGCDSVIRLYLTLNDIPPTGSLSCTGTATTGIDTKVRCDSYTWIDGRTYAANTTTPTYTLRGVNATGCDSTVTLHLTIRHSSYGTDQHHVPASLTWIDGNTYTSSNNTARHTYVGANAEGCDSVVRLSLAVGSIVDGALPGQFSVGNDRQVQFSMGNLQYQGASDTWRFALNQYDYVGNAAGNTAAGETQTEWTDLFAWGTSGWASGAASYLPYARSSTNADYLAGSLAVSYPYADWGIYNAISNGGNRAMLWRTLSNDEWNYLLHTRAITQRFCCATVNEVQGLIIFPDQYVHPVGVRVPQSCNSTSASYGSNRYSLAEWQQMEAASAVFLPAAGRLDLSSGGGHKTGLFYWTSTTANDNQGRFVGGGSMATCNKSQGLAVRLVRDHCSGRTTTGIDVQQACDSYTWIDGSSYGTTTSLPYTTVHNVAGCDSIINLHLTIHHSTVTADRHIDTLPITWIDGRTYSSNATAHYHTISSHGCDSDIMLVFTLRRTTHEGVLLGRFSVNANGDQVQFSKGNLQYQASTSTWRFAENQYDFIGNAPGNTTAEADRATQSDWIDLFGWATSGYHDPNDAGNLYYQPYSSNNSNGYGPSSTTAGWELWGTDNGKYDWGWYNSISNGGNDDSIWRTLSRGEWEFLLNSRTTQCSFDGTIVSARYCAAKVNDKNGAILFPDIYIHPTSIIVPTNINSNPTNYNANIYTLEQWRIMEAAGAVFLPAAGYRNGLSFSGVTSFTAYWTSTFVGGTAARAMYCLNAAQAANSANQPPRHYGYSVRLVHDVIVPF